jgi:hypothetical protein
VHVCSALSDQVSRIQPGSLPEIWVFPPDLYAYLSCPAVVLAVLEDFALSGVETKRLVYEFIRIGAKLDKAFPDSETGRGKCGLVLFNIRRLVYGDDQTALFAELPPLTDDEKQFLLVRRFAID